MTAELTAEGCIDVADALGLPHPGLVEKDYHVVIALRALSAFADGNPGLVFGGGTSLCRAYRLIQRMSEDIDLRIVSDAPLTAGERKRFRKEIAQSLLAAGFRFDQDDRIVQRVHDGGRTFEFNLPYIPLGTQIESLRRGVKIEISSWPLCLEPELRAISSFWNEARGEVAEVPAMPCVAVAETAADKFIALTRRIAQERETGVLRDNSLLRHVYDLYCLRPTLDFVQVAPLMRRIMESDQKSRAGRLQSYADDPETVSRDALKALSSDPSYAEGFRVFQRDMVYGETIELASCMPVLEEFAALLDE